MFSEENFIKIKKLCLNTKTAYEDTVIDNDEHVGTGIRKNFPNGVNFPAAYHTLFFGKFKALGQRNNEMRYHTIKKYIDFKHKNIIDFGCNTGGLLLQLGKDINLGIGLD